ncbi:MAG: methyltransferase, partial [Actinomycetospora chiangmaiensis]|nr:methyltransferase [Actinomycetospora chiangmaiensis]
MPEVEVTPPAPVAWSERWLAWRNRLVANPWFQRWAAGFPLTRGIARRNTRALFDLCAGFVYAQVLTACIRLDLFAILADGPVAADLLARRLDLPVDNARRLLRAAESLGLVRALRGDRYALADLGAALTGNPGIAGMVEHHALLYADLADPVRLLRGEAQPTRLSGYWPYASGTAAEPEAYARYSALMGASQAMIAGDILDACDLSSTRSLMDVGGGEGVFLEAVAARHPQLDLTLLDLPAVATRAT